MSVPPDIRLGVADGHGSTVITKLDLTAATRLDNVTAGRQFVRASGGDDTAAINAALLLGNVHLPDPLYLVSGELLVPSSNVLTGSGMETTKLRATASAARVRFQGRGGRSGDFYFDGNAVATNGVVFESTEREYRDIRAVNTVGDMFLVGTLNASCQNDKLTNVKGHNALGAIWVYDGGCGNIDLFGCYAEHGATALVKVRRSGVPASGGTQPFNVRWHGGIIERPGSVAPLAVVAAPAVVLQTCGSDIQFYGTNISGGAGTTLLDVSVADAGSNTSRLHLIGGCQLDGNDQPTAAGVKVRSSGLGNAAVIFTGRGNLRGVNIAFDCDDNSRITRDKLNLDTSITTLYSSAGTKKPHQWITDLIDSARSADWPTAAISVTADRDGKAWQQQAALTGGVLYVVKAKYPIPAGVPVSEIHWVSGGTALVTGSNQWACLLDSSFNVLRASNDDTSAAWGTDIDKAFTLATPYVPPADITPYIGLVVVAATVPNLMGIAHGRFAVHKIAPSRLYLGSGASAGLTNPASLASPVTGLGLTTNIEAYAYVK